MQIDATIITIGVGLIALVGGIVARDRQIFRTIQLSSDRHMDKVDMVVKKIDDLESDLYKTMSHNKDKFTGELIEMNAKMVHKDDFNEVNRQLRESINKLSESSERDRGNTQMMLNNILNEIKK